MGGIYITVNWIQFLGCRLLYKFNTFTFIIMYNGNLVCYCKLICTFKIKLKDNLIFKLQMEQCFIVIWCHEIHFEKKGLKLSRLKSVIVLYKVAASVTTECCLYSVGQTISV